MILTSSSIGERSSSTTSLLKVDETSTARDMEVSAEKTNNGNKIKTEIGVTGDKHQTVDGQCLNT